MYSKGKTQLMEELTDKPAGSRCLRVQPECGHKKSQQGSKVSVDISSSVFPSPKIKGRTDTVYFPVQTVSSSIARTWLYSSLSLHYLTQCQVHSRAQEKNMEWNNFYIRRCRMLNVKDPVSQCFPTSKVQMRR